MAFIFDEYERVKRNVQDVVFFTDYSQPVILTEFVFSKVSESESVPEPLYHLMCF